MNIMIYIGVAIISAILSITLKKHNPEYAIVLSFMAGILLLGSILSNASVAFDEIKNLISSAEINSEYGLVLFKSLGICIITQFSSDSCTDAGQSALASKIEFAGKIMIIFVSLPLFSEVTKVVTSLMGG